MDAVRDVVALRVTDMDTDGDLDTDITKICVRDMEGELLAMRVRETDGVLLAIRVLDIEPELLATRVRDMEPVLLAIRVIDTDNDLERDTDTVAGSDADDDKLDPNDIVTERDGIRDIVGDAETLLD